MGFVVWSYSVPKYTSLVNTKLCSFVLFGLFKRVYLTRLDTVIQWVFKHIDHTMLI